MNILARTVPSVAKTTLNEALRDREPWEIVAMTSSSILAAFWFYNFVFQEEDLKTRGKKVLLKLARQIAKSIPAIREKIDSEMKKLNDQIEQMAINRTLGVPFVLSLPKKGMSSKQILDLLDENIKLGTYDWSDGRVSGCVYRKTTADLELIVKEAYSRASLTNPLHSDVFPGICKMEAEIVRLACQLFGGDERSCGTMTTGGTESILLACKAYRDYACNVMGIYHPEMVVPVTAHAAFDKAALFLKIRIKSVPVDTDTYMVNLKEMRRAITRNTILLVCSAPNFPYGTMDDIEAVSQMGLAHQVPVHVDACLGGFLACFMKSAGYTDLPPFDFRLQGVCSISADTHKYGYAPKGSSLILYRDKKYLHEQYTITTDWPGGIYGSPTISGSRAGGIIASCWATMMYYGYDGYVEATKQIIDTTRFIEQELRKIEGIFIFGKPATSVIALGSRVFNVFRLSEGMNARGWNLNVLQFPSAVHICLTHLHTEQGVAQRFLDDIKAEIANVMKTPDTDAEGMFAVYGDSQAIADRSMVSDFVKYFLDSMYYTPRRGGVEGTDQDLVN